MPIMSVPFDSMRPSDFPLAVPQTDRFDALLAYQTPVPSNGAISFAPTPQDPTSFRQVPNRRMHTKEPTEKIALWKYINFAEAVKSPKTVIPRNFRLFTGSSIMPIALKCCRISCLGRGFGRKGRKWRNIRFPLLYSAIGFFFLLKRERERVKFCP